MQGWRSVEGGEALCLYLHRTDELSLEDGFVLYESRVIVPPPARQQVLEQLHEGHPGMSHTKSLARSYMWSPQMDVDIERKVKYCSKYQTSLNSPLQAPLYPWECQNTLGLVFMPTILGHSWATCF